jgi:hypothetical protein
LGNNVQRQIVQPANSRLAGWQWLAGGGCCHCLPFRVVRLAAVQAATIEEKRGKAKVAKKN